MHEIGASGQEQPIWHTCDVIFEEVWTWLDVAHFEIRRQLFLDLSNSLLGTNDESIVNIHDGINVKSTCTVEKTISAG